MLKIHPWYPPYQNTLVYYYTILWHFFPYPSPFYIEQKYDKINWLEKTKEKLCLNSMITIVGGGPVGLFAAFYAHLRAKPRFKSSTLFPS